MSVLYEIISGAFATKTFSWACHSWFWKKDCVTRKATLRATFYLLFCIPYVFFQFNEASLSGDSFGSH